MASKDEAKVKFSADTQEFNEEINKSEQQMKEYRSELRLNSEMMKTVGESAELLQQKQNILSKEYDVSETKVQALTGKLEVASRIWGETSAEASKYRIQLNNARVAQEKIQQEMDKAAQATQEFEQRMSQAAQETNQFEQEAGQAGQEMQDLNFVLSDSAQEAKEAAGGYTVMNGTLADLASDGIQQACGALQEFIEDSGTASSSFAAMTGASKTEMAEFNSEMKELYKNGYGESLNDIGDSMAYVKQTMGDLDPGVISDISENAIALNDIFDIDIQESIRAVDALMTTMGLDADESFDYIAKGAQNGLNYSGELADNIAEYGPLWDQAGFSAEEMFTILQNGADSGAYNLDKINDFVKEFSISLSDGRIEENLESFSAETQRLFDEWKDGKKTSKDVFYSVIKDLEDAEDQQEALTTASNIWSSLGEDNAMNIITSLNDVNDTYKNVHGTMETIKNVKYDNVVEQYKMLGRTVTTDLVMPLAEQALPAMESFADYTISHIDDIIPLVEGLGAAFGTIFVAKKVTDFTDALSGMTNPLELGVNLLGALIGIAVASEASRQQAIEDTWGLTEEQKKLNEEAQTTIDRYRELEEARTTQTDSINAEYDYLLQLNTELETLVDENGKVKDGYEDRVNYILNELSSATGIQIEYINGEITGYQELAGEIENVIEKKRAESIAGAYEESYSSAIQERAEIYKQYSEQLGVLEEREQELNKVEEQLESARQQRNKAVLSGMSNAGAMESNYYNNLVKAQEEAQAAYDETKAAVEGLEETYVGYNATIENYEGLQAAIISGNAEEIENALAKMTNNFISAESGTRESLERQAKEYEEQYERMKKAVEDGGEGITEESVEAAKDLHEMALNELKKIGPDTSKITDENMRQIVETMRSYQGEMVDTADMLNMVGVDAWIGHYKEWNLAGAGSTTETSKGMRQQKPDVDKATTDIANGALSILNNADFVSPGKKAIQNNALGMTSLKGATDSAAKAIADSANANLGSANTSLTGQNKVAQYRDGALSAQLDVNSAAGDIAASMNANLGSADTYGTGNSEGLGMYAGLYAARDAINGSAADIAASMNVSLGSADTYGTGNSEASQYRKGVASEQGSVNRTATDISNTAASGFGSANTTAVGKDFGQGFIDGMTSLKWAAFNAAKGLGQTANSGLRAGTDSHSPSRIAEDVGEDYTTGFGNGIEKDADHIYDITEGMGEIATQGLEQGLDYGNMSQKGQENINGLYSFPGQYDNVSIQYDGLFNMRQIEDIIARYSRKSYSFTINRRELIRAIEQ